MRKIRMLLFVLLFAALLTQCTQDQLPSAEAFPGQDVPFSDVQPADRFYEPVMRAVELGLMSGTSDTAFEPFGYLTRSVWVETLFRLSGQAPGTPNFRDVPLDAPYAGAVGWAQQAGIIAGNGEGLFQPDGEITRQEYLVIADRFLTINYCTFPPAEDAAGPFVDRDKIADWAVDAIERMRLAGLIQGSAGRLQPQARVNRAEAAALAVRIAEQMGEAGQDADQTGKAESFQWENCVLYTAYPDNVPLDRIQAVLLARTGCSLAVSEEMDGNAVVFAVDENLQMLEYTVQAEDGVLTFAVCSPYALPYMDEIAEDFFAGHSDAIPAEFTARGTFQLDPVSDFPEGTVFSLVGETNRNPLSYETGESVTFRISLLQDNRLVSAPAFQYTYCTDDGLQTAGTASGIGGQCVLTLPGCRNPGTARLTVGADGIEADYAGGVVFDFTRIAPARSAPEDFVPFWKSQLAKLEETAPRHIYYAVCEANQREGFTVYDVAVQSPWGSANIHVSVPDHAEAHSLGIRMVLQGYGFKSADPAYHEDAITVSVNPHSILNDMSEEYYAGYAETLDCWVDEEDTREDSCFLGMILRDVQALRYVERQYGDLWNGVDIHVSGHSMGGLQAVAVGALCPEVTGLTLSHPWMCDLAGGEAGRIQGWGPDWSEAGQYFDAVYFASCIRCTDCTVCEATK